jgi:soluble lytic murein transglycosylase-like protein
VDYRHFLVSLFLFCSLEGLASHTLPLSEEAALYPIDKLHKQLLKKEKSRTAKKLRQAFENLEKENFLKASQLGMEAQQDSLFFDYGTWIVSSADRGQAKKLIRQKKYKEALKYLDQASLSSIQIEKSSPYSPLLKYLQKDLAEAELLFGIAYKGLKNWKKSRELFEKSFKRMYFFNQLGAVESSAVEAYEMACKKSVGPLCSAWLNRFSALSQKKSGAAPVTKNLYPRISKLISISYKAPDQDQVAFEAAFQLVVDESYRKAVSAFKQFLQDYPLSVHRNRVRYWLARALLERGEEEEAQTYISLLKQESPLSYYGLLASNFNNKLELPQLSTEELIGADRDPALLPQEVYHLMRAKKLVAEQAHYFAALELREFKMREELSVPFLIYFAMLSSKAKNHLFCFQALQELGLRGYGGIFSSPGLNLFFPAEFFELIKKYSVEYELDPLLILSLIKQESGFWEDANSSAGAIGLMQLMPTTALEVEKDLIMADLIRAERNIKIGTKYLRKLVDQFHGNVTYALAAYNAGPTAVNKWVKKSPVKLGMPGFIEAITYRETREYVASIIRNYFWYSRQLNGGPGESLDLFWKKESN